jgi:serine-type D-Ala-D-Ala carboxypeptidase/endopeptidase
MKRALLALAVIAIFGPQTFAQTAPAPATPTQAEIRSALVERTDVAKKTVGLVAATIGPDGTHVVGYGRFSAADARTPDGDTVFEIGSVTKVFTSLLLADMVQKGEVKLDDPVAKYLPATVKVPERNGKKITLVDLATQTSGLPRMPDNFHPKDPSNPYADYTSAQMFDFLSRYQLTRDPGEKYEYSNLGAGLLGYALAQRAGKDYETVVRERIFKPLKMDSTSITLSPALQSRLAPGHDGLLKPAANWDIATLTCAGAIRSTANDMLKFLSAFLGVTPSPLDAAIKTQLATRRPTTIPKVEIALAWHILTYFDRDIYWHNGGTGGYHSFVAFDPKTKTGAVLLSNSTNDVDDIGRHLMDVRYPVAKISPAREHKEVVVDAKVFDALVGKYQIQPGVTASVFRDGEKLMTQVTGQPAFQIFPESETEYFFKVVDAQVTFEKGSAGKVTGLIVHQNGQDVPAKKIE